MTPKEWTDKTVRDLQRKKELKKIGTREAEGFRCEQIFKGWKKYKSSSGRGRAI